MAYNWPELSSTSGFNTNLQINGADGFNASFAPTLQSFFISIGSVENTWNQTASFNTSPGIPITLPITDVHPITITASSDIFSSFNWSSGQLDRLIQLQRTISSTGQLNNDLYRVLYKTSNAIVVIPYHAGIITGVDELSATKTITTWKNGHIKINGFNLGRFRFYWRNQNYANMAVGSYVDNFTNGSTAIIYNPFGDTEFGQIDCSNYGTTFYTNYPNNSLSVLYGKVRTLFNVSGTTEPILTTSPVTGEIDATVTVTSNKSINSLNTAKLDLIPAHSWYGASSITLYSNETTASQNTGNKLNTFTIVDNKVITFKNPSSFHTYIPYLFYDAQQYSNGNIFSFGNNIESNRFYKPLFLDGNNWGTLSSAAPGSFTLTGINITDATSVKINNESLNFVKAGNGSFIQVTTTSNTTSGFVEITSPAGTITSPSIFKIQPVPTISSFTPTSALSGAQVVITGTNFTSATDSTKSAVIAVLFNNSPAVFDEVTPTTIRAFAPNAATGKITVNTTGGSAISESNFTQVFPPSGNLYYKDYFGNLGQKINTSAGGNPIFTGSEYYISGGSLDTLQSVSFRYTSVPSLNYTAPNSLLYQAEFTKVSASLAKVVIPQMNNTSEFGYVLLRLVNAYGQHETGYYRLEPVLANINFPTINSYQELPNDNTTSVNTLVGANAFFNKDNSWQKTTDIYFAKPTTRKDGLTENSEWTRATGAWFSNNGEWQKFWPSIENAAKLFYKFDWASAGFDGKIDVIKTVPNFPNIYALLSQYNGAPEFSTGAKSIIAKINLQTGTLSYIEVKGVHDSNTCHISDIYVTSDSVYAVGYDFTTVVTYFGSSNSFGNISYNIAPARFVEMMEHGLPGNSPHNSNAPMWENNYIGNNTFCGIVKKYSKNLNLQFSRVINQANQSYPANRFAFKCGHRMPGSFTFYEHLNSSAIETQVDYISIQGSLMEPKISFYNNAIYVFIPVTEQFGNSAQIQYSYVNDDPSTGLLNTAISGLPVRESILIKKLKATNLTEFTNETSVKQLMSHTRNVPGINGETYLYPSAPQYEFFRRYKKSGISQYSVFADQQLNGNNKITFKNGFYWNSLQINPVIRSAYLSRDGSLDYSLIIGNLESETGDDDTNGMLVGLYGKNDLFDQMCGTEFELGKETTSEVITYSSINSFLANYASLPNVYTPTSFPVTAFTVTETLNDNGGTGFPMTQVCNA